ncbi:D-amino-acid transaminase [Kaistia dalseonensis]|uniref:Probable branched-chain-amino-acid aminotransferase n=1 Tax=Kaistia dalseonensis TaxID=410840 RepID=A0ABU0H483_9HYPH|nr:D-amino-acid transaminase [Kaistia dalseonensis]MCX5494099.1 D-amino-acid transaminase [Kaistia dalseonensis]MDQ0436678.1 D-alanine transaminase [Kaistia dalseonensis]
MSRFAYVNGRYIRHADAAIHIEDRGYQFADGVYEVCEVRSGRLIDEERHMARLERSLAELRIDLPMPLSALGVVLREVVRRNMVRDGLVYLQVTRGVAPRNHLFPAPGTPSSLVVTSRSASRSASDARAEKGVAVITVPENRWDRVDIKTVGLLPNVLAKQAAKEAGAYEAWFVDADGNVTEGSSTNAWIVTKDGVIVTRPAESGILRGITRSVILDLAAADGLNVEERAFSLEEAKTAREAFITAATTLVMPVVQIDGAPVANGAPGIVATQLRQRFHDFAAQAPIWSRGR